MRALTANLLYALQQPELRLRHVATLETGSGTQRYSTDATSWSGLTFEGRLMEPPSVSITPGDPSRGSIGGVRATLRLANADARFSSLPASWYQGRALTIETVLDDVASDALRTLACVAANMRLLPGGDVQLDAEDWFSVYRRQPWPSDSYTLTLSAFPGLRPTDDAVGRIVPFQIGQALHETRFIVDANNTPEFASNPTSQFVNFHHFLGGYYSRGGDGAEPLVFMAPNGGWTAVACVRTPSEVLEVGSTDTFGRFMYVWFATPLGGLPFYVRNEGREYRFATKGGPGTGNTTHWQPSELAHLMLVNSPFGLLPPARVDSADFVATYLLERGIDLHQMRGSIQYQRPLEDWLADVSHDGALGITVDGPAIRMESVSASRSAVTSFTTADVEAGTLRFTDASVATLASVRRIRYARAGQDALPPGQGSVEFLAGSGAPLERVAYFIRDRRTAQWVAEFYAKREQPRTYNWTTPLTAKSAPLEQFDLVTVTHPLLGTGTYTAEIVAAEWDGPRVRIDARQLPTGGFDFTSSVAPDLNFGADTQFIRFGVTSWALLPAGETFTYPHSLQSAPTHVAQVTTVPDLWDQFFASSLATATDSTVGIFVANSAFTNASTIPSFQLIMRGWELDTF